jgi:hypothetical protein
MALEHTHQAGSVADVAACLPACLPSRRQTQDLYERNKELKSQLQSMEDNSQFRLTELQTELDSVSPGLQLRQWLAGGGWAGAWWPAAPAFGAGAGPAESAGRLW